MTALCIADLKDGRRALCYLDQATGHGELVAILRPEDLGQPAPRAPRPPGQPDQLFRIYKDGELVAEVLNPQALRLPPPLPAPRITPLDLLRLAQEIEPEEPGTRQDQILRRIEDQLRGEGPEGTPAT